MIALSYIGVHEIFQLALAAAEINQLSGLRCSMIDSPGRWGALFSRFLPIPSARPLEFERIPSSLISEYPWPLLGHRVLSRFTPSASISHRRFNHLFDKNAANWLLNKTDLRIYVGVETCAHQTLQAAKKNNLTTILDCPGITTTFLEQQIQKASSELGIPYSPPETSSELTILKSEERTMADVLLCCSKFQANLLVSEGIDASKIKTIPLWVDSTFWCPNERTSQKHKSPSGTLRVLYAGALSLAKGVPYLIKAMNHMPKGVTLTLVGSRASNFDSTPLNSNKFTVEDRVSKSKLRELFWNHDILVMPSLGDSFGFVALEAMAAGLPVIVSDCVGVPVPDPDWRIPALNSTAIVERLQHYLDHPDTLFSDSYKAIDFAKQFTTKRYRNQMAKIFTHLLN